MNFCGKQIQRPNLPSTFHPLVSRLELVFFFFRGFLSWPLIEKKKVLLSDARLTASIKVISQSNNKIFNFYLQFLL